MKNRINRWAVAVVFFLMSIVAWAQDSGEIPVPLSDPSKRAKLKIHINYGSITVKGTARKDILVKYSQRADGDDDDDDDDDDRKGKDSKSTKNGLKRIGGGT